MVDWKFRRRQNHLPANRAKSLWSRPSLDRGIFELFSNRNPSGKNRNTDSFPWNRRWFNSAMINVTCDCLQKKKWSLTELLFTFSKSSYLIFNLYSHLLLSWKLKIGFVIHKLFVVFWQIDELIIAAVVFIIAINR